MARSAPGSSTRTPPATETKTSAEPSDTPPWRASTARTSASRLRSTPFATRRGGTSSLGATSACTSTSSGREPSIAQSTTEPGARVASFDEARRGVLDLDQALLVHLEHADLVGRAEAVLQRAQGPVGPLALALEREHAVDQVLQHARARQRALLRHVADESVAMPRSLASRISGPATSRTCADRAGRTASMRVVQHLHGVDHAYLRPLRLQGREGRRPDRCRPRSERRGHAEPSRSARSFTCAADSSPET